MDVKTEKEDIPCVESSLVKRFSSELLFTLENVEAQASRLKDQNLMPKDKREALDTMLSETRHMNLLLKEMMKRSSLHKED